MTMKIRDIAFSALNDFELSWLEMQRQATQTEVVMGREPALEVAQRAVASDANLLIVLDDEEKVAGIVIPQWTKKQITRRWGVQGANFYQILLQVPNDWQHDKTLTRERPHFFWCGAGRHWTDTVPCAQHG